MKIKIKHDVYNIANRIKKIDKNYYIVFNTSSKRFEVHHSKQIGGSYCLTLPFNLLDARALDYIKSTQSQNLNEVLQEIENNNKRVESEQKDNALHLFNKSLENLLKRR